MYAQGTLDVGADEPFPSEDELLDLAESQLCDQATVDFAGFEFVPFSRGILIPSEQTWADGDRAIGCFAGSDFPDGPKIGSAAASSLISVDVLVGRISFALDDVDVTDWGVIEQFDTLETIGSLTNYQFDVALRRPALVDQGFIFASDPVEGAEHEAVLTGYDWEDGDFTQLDSPLPGQRILSVVLGEINQIAVFDAQELSLIHI